MGSGVDAVLIGWSPIQCDSVRHRTGMFNTGFFSFLPNAFLFLSVIPLFSPPLSLSPPALFSLSLPCFSVSWYQDTASPSVTVSLLLSLPSPIDHSHSLGVPLSPSWLWAESGNEATWTRTLIHQQSTPLQSHWHQNIWLSLFGHLGETLLTNDRYVSFTSGQRISQHSWQLWQIFKTMTVLISALISVFTYLFILYLFTYTYFIFSQDWEYNHYYYYIIIIIRWH